MDCTRKGGSYFDAGGNRREKLTCWQVAQGMEVVLIFRSTAAEWTVDVDGSGSIHASRRQSRRLGN